MVASPSDPDDLTELLRRAAAGDKQAEEALYAGVAPRLRKLAGYLVRGERDGCSLQATELFHEAYGRLKLGSIGWESRRDFYRVMSTVMRRVLVDRIRKPEPVTKWIRVDITDWDAAINTHTETVLLVDELIRHLDKTNPRWARTVEMQFFAGYQIQEIAAILRVNRKTVTRNLEDSLKLMRELVGVQLLPDDPPAAAAVATPPKGPPLAPPRAARA
ncbi:MAG: ECF-type sigma factor [Acidobacteria bacterium]|nr:ECF-type sigma factor [Acidobacteriota bacterium]